MSPAKVSAVLLATTCALVASPTAALADVVPEPSPMELTLDAIALAIAVAAISIIVAILILRHRK